MARAMGMLLLAIVVVFFGCLGTCLTLVGIADEFYVAICGLICLVAAALGLRALVQYFRRF